jgi:hypothetical protein
MLIRTARAILLLIFLSCAAIAASALSSDLRLLQMVPPESEVVAGMITPTLVEEPDSFLLVTGNNRIDYEDFFAITGADASRQIHQVVFVAATGADGKRNEHSLLVSGHFNRDAILRFTESSSPETESYRGETILVVPPLVRERGSFKHVRWLAILNSEIAIFGTPATVQRELDRHIADSRPDPALMERLSRLGSHAETWCLLPLPSSFGILEGALDKLDPQLGAVAREGGSMQYGIHFGRQVEITASSYRPTHRNSTSEIDESAAQPASARGFLADSYLAGNDGGNTAVLKVPRRRYEEWLHEFSKGKLVVGNTVPH